MNAEALDSFLRHPFRDKRRLALWFLAILLMRGVWIGLYRSYALHVKQSVNSQDQTFENGEIAESLLQGKGFSFLHPSTFPPGPTAHKPPLYPLLLAGVFKLVGSENLTGVRAVQAILITLSTLILMRLFAMVFDAPTGLMAGLLILLSPLLAKADVFIENIALSIFLSSLFLTFLWDALEGKPMASAKTGVFMGLTALANPSFIPFFPCALVLLFLRAHTERWRQCFVMAGVSLLLIAPWSVHNRLVFDRWIPINSTYPFNIWMGNNPLATGSFTLYGGQTFPIPTDLIKQTAGMNEADRNSYFGKIGWQYARTHPKRFLIVRAKAYFYFWMTSRPWMGYGTRIDILNVGVAAVMLASALAGFFIALRIQGTACWVFGLLFLSYSTVYGLTHADSIDRYRLPLDPYVWGFSALWVTRTFRALPSKLLRWI
jgi:4-amino-4-deoxy-L-arabinose transferase-like glycosyltransferase